MAEMTTKIKVTRGLQKPISNPILLEPESAIQISEILKDCYELTSEIYIRPYGDVDFKNTPYTNKTVFDEQDKLIGLALHHTLSEYKFSIMKSSSFKANKISWRFVIKGIKGTKRAIKHLIITQINPEFLRQQQLLQVLHPIMFDLSVYDKNRKMRMLKSSKDGEDRPLELVEGNPVDSLITYIPPDIEHKELPEPPVQQPQTNFQNSTDEHSFEECEALVDALIQNRSWIDTYEGARTAIWAFWGVEQSDEMFQLLKKLLRTGDYYEKDLAFLYKLTKEYKPTDKKITLRTIYWKLKELNPTAFEALKKKFKQVEQPQSFVQEIVGYKRPENWSIYENWNTPSGYLKDLPYNDHNTLLVDSHLGTGKTTQLKKIVKENPNKRIILISARRTFTASMFADFGANNGFVNYRDVKGSLAAYQRVFVQVESLWRLFVTEDSIQPFDIVLMDEVESILAQCSPSSTHQGKYLDNMKALEQITEQSPQLIAMDAFITQRSVEFLETLRTDIAIVHNPHQPYNRIAVKTPCNYVRRGTSHFWKAAIDAIKAGKRIVIPCGSQKQGLAFEKILIANKISYLFYHSNDDRTMRKKTLQDVNASWANVQVLMYTPSVTIGINYDSEPAQFDQMFMYASAGGGVPRDMFQGSLRARVIKDNKMTFCLDSRSLKPSLLGMEIIEEALDFKSEMIIKHFKSLGLDTDNIASLPDWNKNLIRRNMNEKNVSSVECKAVFNWYLEKCGYTIQEEEHKEVIEYSTSGVPMYNDIIKINDVQAKTIEEAIRNEMDVSEDQRHSLTAYYLLQTVPFFEDIEQVGKDMLWHHWNDKLIGRNHIKNVMAESKDIKQLLTKELNNASGCVDLMSNLPARVNFIKALNGLLDDRTHFTPDEIRDLVPEFKKIFGDGTALKIFGIYRDRVKQKESGVYFIHKIAEILKKWDGSVVEAVEKMGRNDGKLMRTYGMTIVRSAERHFLPLYDEED